MRLPSIRNRLAILAGLPDLPDLWIARISALSLLHDFGKANAGFQARSGLRATRVGHIDEAAPVLARADLSDALGLAEMDAWGASLDEALCAILAHHGRPADLSNATAHAGWWEPKDGVDPPATLRELSAAARDAFPTAFLPDGPDLPKAPAFWHAVAGLLMLADWLGSDETAFPHTDPADGERMALARERASRLLGEIGFDGTPARKDLPAEIRFDAVSPHTPSEIQRRAAEAPGPIVVLEAETGSGKTEAALFRFARLFADGRVDGLYFALPTRVAASAIYERVRDVVERLIPPGRRPSVIQAVPGYVRADGIVARVLPGFEVQWSDDPNEAGRRARWAAERPKRFLAGAIVIGTIDQALLGTVAVRHAHLRAFSLMRALLVVDEVHASDAYMERLLANLLSLHAGAGGEALLLSATLGAGARTRLLLAARRRLAAAAVPPPNVAADVPYPALSWVEDGQILTRGAAGRGNPKTVNLEASCAIDDPHAIARLALEAAEAGAKVLIVRNTVRGAVAVARVLTEANPNHPALFRINGVPTLHHGRFAREDRMMLDRAVEVAVGRERGPGGLVLVGTQTLEQSLDIDADLLLTDLAPVDVLLQRLGRLHRHTRPRPTAFKGARAVVLMPADLSGALARVAVGASGPHGLGGSIYGDLIGLEATRQLIDREATWEIPAMNRRLVEAGTHEAVIRELCEELAETDPHWRVAWMRRRGEDRAHTNAAVAAAIDWSAPFSEFRLHEEALGTRLGLRDAVIEFEEGDWIGPFGRAIRRLVVPGWWRDLADAVVSGARPVDKVPHEAGFSFRLDRFVLRYGPYGLQSLGEDA
ncbi:CRISPR-associated helicase/endonuclease Cas3 [Microvirga aerophila]|uniref:CRISPR-associated helicase/endonuclease Cas3 n=1 Tax=Microvirga aerophila TaxID=670291 RepID=A0A512C1D2_9HYPH|nr:CRISPR-associated helicase/endonuclease Cas3 [Microvirga aerophila]